MSNTKIISHACINIRQAERFQNRLYNLYDSVRLIDYPKVGSDAGIYKWEVNGKIIKVTKNKQA